MNNTKLLSVGCFSAAFYYCIEHTRNNGQYQEHSAHGDGDVGTAAAAIVIVIGMPPRIVWVLVVIHRAYKF